MTGKAMGNTKKPTETATATVKVTGFRPTVWLSNNFAEDWYKDALAASAAENGVDARRQEILFATCFLESYIFEWARQTLQIEEINDFFPASPRSDRDPRYRRGLKMKWKKVPQELFEAGKLNTKPNLDISDLGVLIKHRNGLVHATASRPATESQPEETKPFPTKDDLKELSPGWALGIAVRLIIELHQELSTAPPEYLGEQADAVN